jgi:hypothetical protein
MEKRKTMQNEISLEQVFSSGLMEHRIPGFPYPKKNCVYCNKDMTLVKTLHVVNMQEHYKAVYVCYNTSCEAFDEAAERAYVKVYYSSELAAQYLDRIMLHFYAPRKG